MFALICILFILPQSEITSADDILIITSASSPLDAVSKRELRQLFLKKTDTIQRNRVTPIQLKTDHPIRQQFDQLVFGSPFNAENYWVEQKFLAGEAPPVEVTHEAFVLIFVKRNEGLIGYVHKNLIGEVKRLGLKVLTLKPKG